VTSSLRTPDSKYCARACGRCASYVPPAPAFPSVAVPASVPAFPPEPDPPPVPVPPAERVPPPAAPTPPTAVPPLLLPRSARTPPPFEFPPAPPEVVTPPMDELLADEPPRDEPAAPGAEMPPVTEPTSHFRRCSWRRRNLGPWRSNPNRSQTSCSPAIGRRCPQGVKISSLTLGVT